MHQILFWLVSGIIHKAMFKTSQMHNTRVLELDFWRGVATALTSALVIASHQPHLVTGSVRMQWHRSGLIASWQFWEETPPKTTEMLSGSLAFSCNDNSGLRRWGAMVILSSLHFLPSAVSAVLHETGEISPNSLVLRSTSVSFGNILHVALVGIKNQMSALQDRCVRKECLVCEAIIFQLELEEEPC